MSRIYESTYKGKQSIVLENDCLRLEVLAEGGRIASLRDKRTQREIMYQYKGESYKSGCYDSYMPDFHPFGFNDMFPTIDECFYGEFPWKGHRIPDHGELWSLLLKHEILGSRLQLNVCGVRLPYRFKRAICFESDNVVKMDYVIENLFPFDMTFLWAAHPMMQAEEGMEFFIPVDICKAVCRFSSRGRIGNYGDEFNWPSLEKSNGDFQILIKIRSNNVRNMEKYFFKDMGHDNWCKLEYQSDGTVVTISVPKSKIPGNGVYEWYMMLRFE